MTKGEAAAVILVDTSVWIASSRGTITLADHLDIDDAVTCGPIIQEVLQGARFERVYKVVHEAMMAMPNIEEPIHAEVYVEAANLYRTARRAGFTIRASVDCLIAACAIRHAVPLLHVDRDFDNLARVSRLQSRRLELRA